MSSAASLYLLNGGICQCTPNTRYCHCAPSHVSSPTITTLTSPYSPTIRLSPHITLTPLHAPSPLPSLAVLNLPGPSRGNSPNMLVAELRVNPLVAMSMEVYSSKLHYDVSRSPHTACISTCGINTSITPQQKGSPIVEGALLYTSFRIEFNHPILRSTIDCDSSMTISDLITELHSHFQRRLGSRETANLNRDMTLCTAAFNNQKKRCQATFDPNAEWSLGMKRVDVLGKESKLRGIELDAINGPLTLRVTFGK